MVPRAKGCMGAIFVAKLDGSGEKTSAELIM